MTEPSNQPVVNSTAVGNKEDSSKNHQPSPVMSVPTRKPIGFLDLPAELRLSVYRHLLVHHRTFNTVRGIGPPPAVRPVAILRTCRLVHREAFDVLYRENHFTDSMLRVSNWSIIQFPRINNTVQNIYHTVFMSEISLAVNIENFLELMHHFGTPSVIRGTLTVKFLLNGRSCRSLDWFIQALGRFTNFRTIELHTCPFSCRTLEVLEYLEIRLTTVLGDAEDGSPAENGLLRFHPINHRNRCRELDDGHADWAKFLDGIRLRWNDEVTNAEDSHVSGQSWKRECEARFVT